MGDNVSSILQRKIPSKCKGLKRFTIQCSISNTNFEKAMLDLGASLNTMP